MFTKFMSPGASSGGGSGSNGQDNQQDPDYKKLYEDLQKQTSGWIDPKTYDVSQDKRYQGLMTTLNTEKESHKATGEKLSEIEKTLAAQQKELDGKAELQKQLDALMIDKTSLATQVKRSQVILSKFPELASFEAKGLLPVTGPDDDDAALEKLFGDFSAQIGVIRKQAEDKFASGGLPKTPESPTQSAAQQTALSELAQANEAVRKGDTKGYNEHYNKYLELSKPVTR